MDLGFIKNRFSSLLAGVIAYEQRIPTPIPLVVASLQELNNLFHDYVAKAEEERDYLTSVNESAAGADTETLEATIEELRFDFANERAMNTQLREEAKASREYDQKEIERLKTRLRMAWTGAGVLLVSDEREMVKTNRLKAIKMVRERTELGLKEAKDLVEKYCRDNNIEQTPFVPAPELEPVKNNPDAFTLPVPNAEE